MLILRQVWLCVCNIVLCSFLSHSLYSAEKWEEEFLDLLKEKKFKTALRKIPTESLEDEQVGNLLKRVFSNPDNQEPSQHKKQRIEEQPELPISSSLGSGSDEKQSAKPVIKSINIYLMTSSFEISTLYDSQSGLSIFPDTAQKAQEKKICIIAKKTPIKPAYDWFGFLLDNIDDKEKYEFKNYAEADFKGNGSISHVNTGIIYLFDKGRWFATVFGNGHRLLKLDVVSRFGLNVAVRCTGETVKQFTERCILSQQQKDIRSLGKQDIPIELINIGGLKLLKKITVDLSSEPKKSIEEVKKDKNSQLLFRKIEGSTSCHLTLKENLTKDNLKDIIASLNDLYSKVEPDTNTNKFFNISAVEDEVKEEIHQELHKKLIIKNERNQLIYQEPDQDQEEILLDLEEDVYSIYFPTVVKDIRRQQKNGVTVSSSDILRKTINKFLMDTKSTNQTKELIDYLEKTRISFSQDNNIPLLKIIYFSTELKGQLYVLCEGECYNISKEYLKQLNEYVDSLFIDQKVLGLPDFTAGDENSYCTQLATSSKQSGDKTDKNAVYYIVMDRLSSKIGKQDEDEIKDTQTEIFDVANSKKQIMYIKRETGSSHACYLFDQGKAAARKMVLEPDFRKTSYYRYLTDNIYHLMREEFGDYLKDNYKEPKEKHKDKENYLGKEKISSDSDIQKAITAYSGGSLTIPPTTTPSQEGTQISEEDLNLKLKNRVEEIKDDFDKVIPATGDFRASEYQIIYGIITKKFLFWKNEPAAPARQEKRKKVSEMLPFNAKVSLKSAVDVIMQEPKFKEVKITFIEDRHQPKETSKSISKKKQEATTQSQSSGSSNSQSLTQQVPSVSDVSQSRSFNQTSAF